MIEIDKSETADTRTCDYTNVTKETLLASSNQHINDVRRALDFFMAQVCKAGQEHDPDKLTDIDGFHADFVIGNVQHGEWLKRHYALNRHHLNAPTGIREDVNLIDVLDFVADMVMAGAARGSSFPISLPPDLLERAFQNTVALLKAQVVVRETPMLAHVPE